MEKVVKDSIIECLDNILPYLKKQNSLGLKEASDKTIDNGSVFQDEDSISIAVITYALSKIIERSLVKEPKHWNNFHQHLIDGVKGAQESLKKDDLESYRKNIRNLFTTIDNIDNKLALYIQEVVEKAKIKKGSNIYEHGISLSRVAKLLGISNWDLMEYVGHTQISDAEKDLVGVMDRLKFTRSIFELEGDKK